MARSSRWTGRASPISRAAGGDFGRARPKAWCSLRSICCSPSGEDLRALPLRQRKERLRRILEAHQQAQRQLIRYVEHSELRRRRAGIGQEAWSWKGIVSRRLEAPYRSGRSDSWTKARAAPGRRSSSAAGRTTEGNSVRCWPACIAGTSGLCRHIGTGFWLEYGPAHHAGAASGARRARVRSAATDAAEVRPRRALAEARTGGGD